jgi:putative ABC transport system ATP-binding protein
MKRITQNEYASLVMSEYNTLEVTPKMAKLISTRNEVMIPSGTISVENRIGKGLYKIPGVVEELVNTTKKVFTGAPAMKSVSSTHTINFYHKPRKDFVPWGEFSDIVKVLKSNWRSSKSFQTSRSYALAERSNMPFVKLNNISKTYKMGDVSIHALKNVNMEIESGSFVSIVGPSGSGKSTVLNLIGCLDQPTSGSIQIENQEVQDLNKKKRADFRGQNLGFVFQNFNLIPVLSVYENVEYPLLMIKNEDSNNNRERILSLLDAVGVLEQKDKRPNQISGGQMQRVAVARALVTQPKIVIADEPTANLDHDTAFKIINLMKRMKDQEQTTFVFSTHDPKIIGEAEIIYTLEDGNLINREDRREYV